MPQLFTEVELNYEIQVSDDTRTKSVRGALQNDYALYSSELDQRKQELNDIVWAVRAVESKNSGFDVVDMLQLVKVEDLDFRMFKLALKNFATYMKDFLAFRAPERSEPFQKAFAEMQDEFFGSEEKFTAGGFSLYYGNGASTLVPVLGSQSDTSDATFWFFKDALIEKESHFTEPSLEYAIKIDGEERKKIAIKSSPNDFVLYSSVLDSRRQELNSIVFSIASQESKTSGFDVVDILGLAKVEELDYSMMCTALDNFQTFMRDFLAFSQQDNKQDSESFFKAFAEFREENFGSQEKFDSGNFSLYFGNGATTMVPVICTERDNSTAAFWFFKDALVQKRARI